ncbi:hypothetical protein BDW02DRAFT_277285 [Decorospora gaudefroyi]|uniref:Uncharacterized protein n=1 Tax=Decorospora gaudefroyi TaxID=184978 RepID=A0A6A5KEL8_9PLEO|nr:hypothetical protein BDW02DRAFT_277285 [Decorospora gaudefroyi]
MARHARVVKILSAIAVGLSRCDDVDCDTQKYTTNQDVIPAIMKRPSLYHTQNLSLVAAEIAWAAGHRDLNSTNWSGDPDIDDTMFYGTPLWLVSIMEFQNTRSASRWSASKWLLDRGADPAWTHLVFLTTPAHSLAHYLARYPFPLRSPGTFDEVTSLLTAAHRDRCVCFCSDRGRGCHVIGSAVARTRSVPTYRYSFRRELQPGLFALVDSNRSAAWLSSAILRVLTFEKLSLTHTCCVHIEYTSNVSKSTVRFTPHELTY